MSLRQTINDDMCQKLRLVGLTKEETLPIVNSITLSVRAEGPENVVKRLKALKQAAVNHIAGQEIDLPWIKHDRNGPKGPWRPVWRKLKSSSHKQQKRALNAMMVYASFVLPKNEAPTKTQERKFLSSACCHDPQEIELREKGVNKLLSGNSFTKALQRLISKYGKPVYDGEVPDASVYLSKLNGTDEVSVRKSSQMIDRFLTSHNFQNFHCFPEIKKALGQIGDDYFSLTKPWNGSHLDWRTVGVSSYNIGVVGFSQEPGLKFRAFASPNQVLQCALEPMKQSLLGYLSKLQWDNTHDQSKGVSVTQDWLKDGKTVYSVDLSDATNNFPFSYQLEVLKSFDILPDTALRLFEMVCKSPYKQMWGNQANIVWDVGQPLGAGPSFPVFALSHSVLALQAEVLAGIPKSDAGTTFLVLGDDFITCNEKVHQQYRRLLGALRCPISESKCLESNLAGEFAGKIITKDFVFHGFKYKEVSDKSFLAIIQTLGKQAISRDLLTKDQYEYAKLVQSLPEPYGLGFNPGGIPLSQRWEYWLNVQEDIRLHKSKSTTATIGELLNSFWYSKGNVLTQRRYGNYFRRDPSDINPEDFSVNRKGKPILSEAFMDIIRGAALSTSVISRGDPRPDPLLSVRTKKLASIMSKHETLLNIEKVRGEAIERNLSDGIRPKI